MSSQPLLLQTLCLHLKLITLLRHQVPLLKFFFSTPGTDPVRVDMVDSTVTTKMMSHEEELDEEVKTRARKRQKKTEREGQRTSGICDRHIVASARILYIAREASFVWPL